MAMKRNPDGAAPGWGRLARAVVVSLCWAVWVHPVASQDQSPGIQAPQAPDAARDQALQLLRGARSREKALISEVRETELRLEVDPRLSKIITAKKSVSRVSITDPRILEVVQFSPTQFELIGLLPGETSLTLWFSGPDNQEGEMLRYQVRVAFSDAEEEQRKLEYAALERKINELFPNSFVHLFAVGNKLIVRGQARDSREASDIIQIIRDEGPDFAGAGFAGRGYGYGYPGYGYPGYGYPGYGYPGYGAWGGYGPWAGGGWGGYGGWGGLRGGWGGLIGTHIINLLEVPGEKQVLLKVRVAELSRSALREIGANIRLTEGDFSLSTNFSLNGTFSAVLNTEQLQMTLDALATNGYSKILAEPNLVTLSGFPANFLVGGQFAVPTAVGVQGIGAVTTSFKSFGTQLTFTPTVLDKDRIRLQVQPTFSTTDASNTVQGIPGLQTRAVQTTVDLREGQWLAIAGLIQDQQEGGKSRVPLIGDIPFLGTIFGHRHVKRDETELLVLVSPELVHPLEAEECPLILPGMEVTEPNDWAFYLAGEYEGPPGQHHRSTVAHVSHGSDGLVRGAGGRWETRRRPGYQACEGRYVQGPHGFSP